MNPYLATSKLFKSIEQINGQTYKYTFKLKDFVFLRKLKTVPKKLKTAEDRFNVFSFSFPLNERKGKRYKLKLKEELYDKNETQRKTEAVVSKLLFWLGISQINMNLELLGK